MVKIFDNISENIYQGDIFLLTQKEMKEIFLFEEPEIPVKGFVVVSNTCDIKNRNIEYISVSPFMPLKHMVDAITKEKKKAGRSSSQIRDSIKTNIDKLLQYDKKKYFYLPKDDEFGLSEESVALLEIVLTSNMDECTISFISKKRICSIKSPWREKLGWAMGNMYNRVALDDFPPNKTDEVISNLES